MDTRVGQKQPWLTARAPLSRKRLKDTGSHTQVVLSTREVRSKTASPLGGCVKHKKHAAAERLTVHRLRGGEARGASMSLRGSTKMSIRGRASKGAGGGGGRGEEARN